MHNDFYYELVLCLETLAFKLSAMCKITVHVCTWLNKTSRKGNVCVNAVLLALFFCKTFPGNRCDLLKSLIVIEKFTLKVIRINLKYKINHTLLFYFTKQYHGLHGWHSFLELSVRRVNFSTSVQFSSVAQLCLTLCNIMDCSMPGLPVHHQLPEFTQTHVHWVIDTIQPSHPLSSPSPPTFSLSQYQGLFRWVTSSHQVAKVLESQLQHQSFQWIFRTDFL